MRTFRFAILLLLCAPAALAAQEPAPRDTTPAPPPAQPVVDLRVHSRTRFSRMVVPAVIGSGVGLVAGGYIGAEPFYDATGCCGGGDDPGLTSALWGAVIGATVGSTVGAYATRSREHPVTLSRAFVGATVGIGVGLLTGFAAGQVDDFRGRLVGFSIGQGVTTAGFAVPYP